MLSTSHTHTNCNQLRYVDTPVLKGNYKIIIYKTKNNDQLFNLKCNFE